MCKRCQECGRTATQECFGCGARACDAHAIMCTNCGAEFVSMKVDEDRLTNEEMFGQVYLLKLLPKYTECAADLIQLLTPCVRKSMETESVTKRATRLGSRELAIDEIAGESWSALRVNIGAGQVGRLLELLKQTGETLWSIDERPEAVRRMN